MDKAAFTMWLRLAKTSMRAELAKLYGKRRRFHGIFVRFGKKAAYKGRPLTTILLKDITDVASKEIVTGHLWFTVGKRFDALDLEEGDVVRFDARVTSYEKGYMGHREFDDIVVPETDYRLSFPSKVEKCSHVEKATPNLGAWI